MSGTIWMATKDKDMTRIEFDDLDIFLYDTHITLSCRKIIKIKEK